MKGSILTELFLWLFFLIPGLIYSIWRHSSVVDGCSKCGSPAVIPLDSPFAKKHLDIPEPGPRLVAKSQPATKTSEAKKLIIAGSVTALLLMVLFASLAKDTGVVQATPAVPTAAPAVADNIIRNVTATSATRRAQARKIVLKTGSEDAWTEALALDESAQQIVRVEATGYAQHDMATAIALDGQKKDLQAALNSWNMKYGAK
jgi:hypothetical protein